MKEFKELTEKARDYNYVVAFTFGQGMEDKDRVFAYVRTKRTLSWAKEKAIDMAVKMSPGLQGGQIETKTFNDEDEMADFWYDIKKSKETSYFGIKSNDLL